MTDVALVTYRALPELDADDRPLAAALRAAGVEVAIVAWDDPGFDWAAARLVVLRNPWDYFHRLDEFLAWAERVSRVTTLVNPLAALRWNLHKGYLVELAERGAPVVPTLLLARGESFDIARTVAERGWRDFVLKPAVSADSWETHRLGAGQLDVAQAHVDRLLPERDLLVQPFLDAVEAHGERCLIHVDGRYSHAVRKNALTQGGRWAGLPEGTPVEADADEREAAARVLAACPLGDLLYARVDLVRDAGGKPLLLELELVEPTLFVADQPAGLERLVAALRRRLHGARPAGLASGPGAC
ncbi:MAG: ATP-grasp domain-containing protein [Myxococcota bacterium]